MILHEPGAGLPAGHAATADDLPTQLTPQSGTLFQALTETLSYQPGDLICRHRSQGDELFVVEQGRFSAVLSRPAYPESVRLATLWAGCACFGELAILAQGCRSGGVVAASRGGGPALFLAEQPLRGSQETIRGRPWN